MKRLMMAILATMTTAHTPVAAQTIECGTATLQDVEVVNEWVPLPTITTVRDTRRKPGERERFAYTTAPERRSKRYLVTIRLNDMVFTGESSGDGFWQFNPTRLVINDPIRACVIKNRLHLTRPDGKEYKAKIVRAVRG